MQDRIYPGGTAAISAPWKAPLIAAILALLIGAAITAGVFLLVDEDATNTVVVTQPAPEQALRTDGGPEESGVATSVTTLSSVAAGKQYGTSQYRTLDNATASRGSKASETCCGSRTPGASSGN